MFFGNRMLCVYLLVGVATLVLVGCAPAEPVANVDSQARKVVTFEGGDVTQGELDEFAEQSGVPKDDPQYQATVQQIMPQLVSIEIAKAYAQEHNITVSDKEVDQELTKLKEQVGDQARSSGQDVSNQEAYEQALKQNNITEEQLREDIRENLPVQKVQQRVAGDAEPSDEEIQNYYEKNKEAQFTTPEQRCVRHILFNKDQKEKAEDVKQKLENGGDFAKLAKENSQDPGSAENGEIVGPVKTEFGYHILQVTDVKPEQTRSLQEVESQIRSQLATEKQSEKFNNWIEEQKKERDVKYLKGYEPPDQG
jgi:parvulin-like peptidyl-prolyl isomerase